MDDRSFRFIDLFAGVGGFRYALEPLGGQCVFTVERDRFSRKTYAAWHGEDPDAETFAEDITDVTPAEVPDHEVLAAGFPCQPFSLAGVSKKGSLGRAHGFADPTQGTLFFNVKQIMRARRPAVAILENVKNLLSHDQKRTWRVIRTQLEGIGYEVHHEVIDARYWVPQHRERVIIVAVDRERFPWITRDRFAFPELPSTPQPTLSAVLDSRVESKYTLSVKLWEYLQDYRAKHEARGNGFGYGLVGADDVARTLSARYHKDGAEILIDQGGGSRPRRLTPSEAQRLMGLDAASLGLGPGKPRPDIVVSDTQAYRQFGNAVVPAVVNHVAAALLDHLDRGDPATQSCPDEAAA